MAILTSALDTDFTPVAGDFIAQARSGPARLVRKNTAGAGFCLVGTINADTAVVVSNPVATAVYQFKSDSNATVQADQ